MKKNKTYCSLHNHSDYSNLRMIDAMIDVETLIDRAYELNLTGVAITDHESLGGHVKAIKHFQKKYQDKDFKLILGNEIYLTRNNLTAENYQENEKFYHQLLLAKDAIGHRQLRELSSRAWRRSFYKNILRVPTYFSDLKEVISKNPGHLIATTTCLSGVTASRFIMNDFDGIDKYLETMTELFGANNFFIELQPSFNDDQINYNEFMVREYWGKYNFIFTTDSHYPSKDHKQLHSWFLNSGRGKRETERYYSASYLMDYEEVKTYFRKFVDEDKVEVMKNNSNKIRDMIETYDLAHEQFVPKVKYDRDFDPLKLRTIYKLFYDNMKPGEFPYLEYFLETEEDTDSYYMNLLMEGYYDKLLSSSVDVKSRLERINYELEQIRETSLKIGQSLSDYFITISKMIEIIWNEADSLVGVGRGSAVGFLVNYLIGITQLDPMTQDIYLPPWRFLHQVRAELPDIDIDTEATKRTKIFNKLQDYFQSIGSQIINVSTFGTEGSKSSIRTAGRALEIEDAVITYLTSMIPNERGFDWTLSQCYNGDKEHVKIANFVEEMDKYPELRNLAFAIEGLITRLGAHAAGIIILEGDEFDHNSVMKTSSGLFVSAYDLEDTEYMGGLKYDMLTVQALDKIHAAMNYMLEDEVIEWDIDLRTTYEKMLLPSNLELYDKDMWNLIATGQVTDAFQLIMAE